MMKSDDINLVTVTLSESQWSVVNDALVHAIRDLEDDYNDGNDYRSVQREVALQVDRPRVSPNAPSTEALAHVYAARAARDW